MAHDVVEEWVDASGEEVTDARNVSEHDVDSHEKVIAAKRFVHDFPINGHNSLCVERRPAQEESHDDGDCEKEKMHLT